MTTSHAPDGYERAGGQDAWHFHVLATGEQRRFYAEKLRAVLSCPS